VVLHDPDELASDRDVERELVQQRQPPLDPVDLLGQDTAAGPVRQTRAAPSARRWALPRSKVRPATVNALVLSPSGCVDGRSSARQGTHSPEGCCRTERFLAWASRRREALTQQDRCLLGVDPQSPGRRVGTEQVRAAACPDSSLSGQQQPHQVTTVRCWR